MSVVNCSYDVHNQHYLGKNVVCSTDGRNIFNVLSPNILVCDIDIVS